MVTGGSHIHWRNDRAYERPERLPAISNVTRSQDEVKVERDKGALEENPQATLLASIIIINK